MKPVVLRAARTGLFLVLFALWLPLSAHARDLYAHVHDRGGQVPIANLSAEASSEVEQDTVQITLVAELAGPAQNAVAEQLNQRLDVVMKALQGHAGVLVHNGSYRLWPSTDRDGHVAEWRGRAEIILKSQDFPVVSRLAAEQAEYMGIDGLYFSVSEARQAATEQALLAQAVKAFQDRASALAEALGFPGYRLRTIDLSGAGRFQPMPGPARMMSMAADSTAAPIEGGKERVTVSVSGSIALLTRKTESPQ
ncbi:SIMPL domain-containing protein [Castellaniella sp.]|uniref:SIMPL domain-containing protein n=1 Tax=Castellaniella sp. TaxID=1955812 RepID=UPI00355EFDF2